MMVILKKSYLSAFYAVALSLLAACTMQDTRLPGTVTSLPAAGSQAVSQAETANVASSPTPTLTDTPTPSATPTPTVTPTPTFLPITPVFEGTPLPEHGGSITVENIDRLTLVSRWGLGNPGDVAFTPDGKYFLVGAGTGIYIYDAEELKVIHSIETQAAVFGLAISPDGQTVAAVVSDRVLFYQIPNGFLLSTIQVKANSVDYSPDGKMLALGIKEDFGPLQLYDLEKGEIIKTQKSDQAAWSVKFSPRGDVIASGGFSTTIWSMDGSILNQNGPYVSGGSTSSVSFSPDGKFLAEGSDYSVQIWRVLDNGRIVNYRQLNLKSDQYPSVYSVAISPDGKKVAVALSTGFGVWDLSTGSRIFFIASEDGNTHFSGLAWAMDNNRIAVASRARGVEIWNIKTNEKQASLTTHTGTYSSLAWSMDGKKLAVGADEGSAYIFNPQNGSVLGHFGSGYKLSSLAFSPDGKNLAVGYGDAIVQIWNVEGSLLRTLEGVGFGPPGVIYSPDGSYFGAISSESWEAPPQVRLWDPQEWVVEKTFPIGNHRYYSIEGFCLSPDHQTAALSFEQSQSSRQIHQACFR